MLLTDAAAYLSELLLYTALAGAFLSRMGALLPVPPSLTLILLAETLSRLLERKSRPVRCLPLILFLPLLVYAPSLPAAFFPLPLLILAFLRAGTGAYAASQETLKGMLRYGTAAFFFILACTSAEKGADSFARFSLPWFTSFLPVTVLALRLVRAGETPSKKMVLLNAALLLAAVGAGLFFSSDAGLWLIRETGNILYRYVIVPVLLLVIALILVVPCLLFLLIRWLISLIPFKPEEYENEPLELGISDILKMEEAATYETPAWLKDALIGLGVLFLLFLCYLLAKKMLAKRQTKAAPGSVIRAAAPAVSTEHERIPLSLCPDAVIRRTYARYLSLLGKIPLPVDGTLLSDELNEQAQPFTGDAAELRLLWLKARYSPHECTREEANRAVSLLRTLRKHYRNNPV